MHRVLRGGSFNNNTANVRCACRNRNNPDNWNNNIGFRVVLSTLFESSEMLDGLIQRLSDRGEKWRSLFPAAFGWFDPTDRANINGPAP
ncbi:MAG: SUMF1/EgtB/PvdO family nonheme iron enzyme [Desulfobacterales bacterium]|nr:SUMF1/EgtB/PvdO family nonheme iron enzyme [Desulfobacterales bacterium]